MEGNTSQGLGYLDGTAPGLSGSWFDYNDGTGTGTQSPMPNASGVLLPVMLSPAAMLGDGGLTSSYAMNTYGSGFTSYGAGIGFNFKSAGTVYDAHTYTGFFFYAKIGTGTGVVSSFRFNVPTKETTAGGGTCSAAGTCGGTSPTCCGDHFGANVSGLSTAWTGVTVSFSSLLQQGYGYPVAAFDAAAVYGCDFQVGKNQSFNLWIDDIYFIK